MLPAAEASFCKARTSLDKFIPEVFVEEPVKDGVDAGRAHAHQVTDGVSIEKVLLLVEEWLVPAVKEVDDKVEDVEWGPTEH